MTTRLVGVEIFKGPASTRHGPYTIGGALNVLSREIPDETTGGGDIAYGLFNTQKAHAWAGALGDSTGTVAEAVVLKSDGFKVLDGGGPTGFIRSEGMIKSEWLATADQRLELKLGLAAEDSDETYLGLSQSDFEASPYRRYAASNLGHMRWVRTQAELEWTGRIGSSVRTRTVLYHHHLDRSWTKFNRFAGPIDTHKLLQAEPTGGQGAIYLNILRGTENTSSPDQMLLIGTNHRIFHSFGLQNTNEWTVKTDTFRSVLEFGVRLHGDHVRRIHSEAPYAMVDGSPVPQMEEEEVKLDSVATAEALAVHIHEDLSVGV